MAGKGNSETGMNFLKGAAILTLAGVGVKVLGGVNRILLSRLLGGEGIGIYQMAYPVYLIFMAAAGAGLPIAVSILVSGKLAEGDGAGVEKLWLRLAKILAVAGAGLAMLVFAGARYFVNHGLISDSRAYFGILALLPAIFFSMILGGWRGYFQGHQLMRPTALSQVVEQFFRVVTMLLLAYVLLPYGLEYAAAGAAGGASVGALCGIVSLYFYRRREDFRKDQMTKDQRPNEETGSCVPNLKMGETLTCLIKLVVPISLSNLTIPLTAFLDMFLVPQCLLQQGYSQVESTVNFGYLAGMAQPLILLSIIPVTSLVFSIIPALTDRPGERQVNINLALKMTLLITVPAGLGMLALGGPLAIMLYGAPSAMDAMVHSGPGIFLLGLQIMTMGILQGLGRVNWPLINLFLGVVAKIFYVTCYATNIVDCAWATNLNYAVSGGLNLICLLYLGYGLEIFTWLKIGLTAIFMAVGVHYGQGYLEAFAGVNLSTLLAVLLGALMYGIFILKLRIISFSELKMCGRRR